MLGAKAFAIGVSEEEDVGDALLVLVDPTSPCDVGVLGVTSQLVCLSLVPVLVTIVDTVDDTIDEWTLCCGCGSCS